MKKYKVLKDIDEFHSAGNTWEEDEIKKYFTTRGITCLIHDGYIEQAPNYTYDQLMMTAINFANQNMNKGHLDGIYTTDMFNEWIN